MREASQAMPRLTPKQARILVVAGAMMLMPMLAMLAVVAVVLLLNALAAE